mgnify:FL=1
MSDTLCILPFISVDRNADTTDTPLAPCCLYQHEQEPHKTIDEYFAGNEIQKVRQQMLSNQKPNGCWKCFDEEKRGKNSMRQSVNKSRLDLHQDNITSHKFPIQVKMLSGASCNLACRMCQSHVSSKVHKVWEEIGRPTQEPYQYDLLMDNYIRANSDKIQYIDLMGGEPLYHKKIINLLEYLVKSNHSRHITLYCTTNGMVINSDVVNLIRRFKKTVLIFSIDGVGQIHEYIRPGSTWSTIINNLGNIRKFFNIDCLVQPTISALNILRLPELDRWCKDNMLHQTQKCLVHDPKELHPKNLPSNLKKQVDDKYKNFVEQEKTHSAKAFIDQLDEHWNTDITTVMPEWNEVSIDNIELDYESYKRSVELFR